MILYYKFNDRQIQTSYNAYVTKSRRKGDESNDQKRATGKKQGAEKLLADEPGDAGKRIRKDLQPEKNQPAGHSAVTKQTSKKEPGNRQGGKEKWQKR